MKTIVSGNNPTLSEVVHDKANGSFTRFDSQGNVTRSGRQIGGKAGVAKVTGGKVGVAKETSGKVGVEMVNTDFQLAKILSQGQVVFFPCQRGFETGYATTIVSKSETNSGVTFKLTQSDPRSVFTEIELDDQELIPDWSQAKELQPGVSVGTDRSVSSAGISIDTSGSSAFATISFLACLYWLELQ